MARDQWGEFEPKSATLKRDEDGPRQMGMVNPVEDLHREMAMRLESSCAEVARLEELLFEARHAMATFRAAVEAHERFGETTPMNAVDDPSGIGFRR